MIVVDRPRHRRLTGSVRWGRLLGFLLLISLAPLPTTAEAADGGTVTATIRTNPLEISVSANPAETAVGDTFQIKASIRNSGDTSVDATAASISFDSSGLILDGSKDLNLNTLPPDETMTSRWDFHALEEGNYILVVEAEARDPQTHDLMVVQASVIVTVKSAAVFRDSGPDRYGTAAAISAGDFADPDLVNIVFVATGENFPDGLAGAAVAGKLGAPLLLVRGDSIPQVIADELARLDPDTIVILGGSHVVSNAVAAALGNYATTVVRLAGVDRYATAAEISQYGYPADGSATQVVIATGTNFADALPGGPAAAKVGGPLLLTDRESLPQVIRDEIVRLNPDRIVVLGGTAAISQAVFNELEALAPTVARLEGANRYETAVATSQEAFSDAARVYVATGLNFPDALAGAAAAAVRGAPVLLVPGTSLPGEVGDEITRLGAKTVIVLGGTDVVTSDVENTLKTLIGL